MSVQTEIAKTIKQVRSFVLRQQGHRVKIGPYKFITLLGSIASLVILVLLLGIIFWFVNLVLGR